MDTFHGKGSEHIMRGVLGIDEDRQGVGIVVGALLQRVILLERRAGALHQRLQRGNELGAVFGNNGHALQRPAGRLADIVVHAHEVAAGIFVARRHKDLRAVLHGLIGHIAPDAVPVVDAADPARIGELDQGQRHIASAASDIVSLQGQVLSVKVRLSGDDLKRGVAHLR